MAYNREAAVAYARKWALARNPKYLDFEALGGDCTNFVSQCLYAGGGVMNVTPVYGWFYHSAASRAPAWTGVEFLYNFLSANQGPGPYAKAVHWTAAQPGDVVQLQHGDAPYHHAALLVDTAGAQTQGDLLVCAHSFDADLRPLASYDYDHSRFLHILGVRP